jgi:hypothetical protein
MDMDTAATTDLVLRLFIGRQGMVALPTFS